MREALNRTVVFLRAPDFSNTEALSAISTLWNIASAKVSIVNLGLGQMLGDKSRFWSDRELYIRLGRDEDVLSLKQVTDEMERLYIKCK